MTNINCGAYLANETRPKTKKALREALAKNEWVLFDPISIFDDRIPILFPAEGTTLSVCGPDPYTDRRWYASVTYTRVTKKWTVK